MKKTNINLSPKDPFWAFWRTAKKSRFLVDENMGRDVSDFLKEQNLHSQFAKDVGLGGKSDEAVFSYAWKHKLILITHDEDFWSDKRFPLLSMSWDYPYSKRKFW